MPLILDDIYRTTKQQYRLTLLEGKSGLEHIMNWVYVAEDASTHDFLKGGELIITTGFNCQSEDTLYQFIETMIDSQTCGLILNTGKYIQPEDISEKILSLCAKNNYPLFTMPWEVHIYEITRDYYNRIFMDTQTDTLVTNAFLSCLREDDSLVESWQTLEEQGFLPDKTYCVTLLHCSDGEISEDLKHRLNYQIKSSIHTENTKYHIMFYKNLFLFIFYDGNRDHIHQIMKELLKRFEKYYGGLNLHIGIGYQSKNLKCLAKSYHRAESALTLAKQRNQTIISFEDMGFFQLLQSVDDNRLLLTYRDQYLKDIALYDEEHHTNYLETLHQYLLCNGSLQAIASNMFCHRNTVNYRINVIKDMWNLALEDTQTRFQLMTAFYIQEYLELFS